MFVMFILKVKKTENVKMLLLQNDCINNGVTNGLKKKERKKACKTTLYGKIKERRVRRRVNG